MGRIFFDRFLFHSRYLFQKTTPYPLQLVLNRLIVRFLYVDKQLHFLVIGIIGMLILVIIYPLFKILSENHILAIAFIYVFTVIVVITFAI